MSILSDPYLHDEQQAYDLVESILWPDGPVCPHCGSVERISKMKGKSTRIGAYKCYACRGKFTVKIGTILEDSHISMRSWLQAIYLLASSKKGFSSNQLHRTLGISVKSAWFMSHRIREAMRTGSLSRPMGSAGGSGVVEVDETFIGQKKGVLAEHGTVNHSAEEYVRGDIHTNTIESYFSIFKRGMRGTYQHCGERHLHRYLAEFDFRHNARVALGVNDKERSCCAASRTKDLPR